MNQSGHQGIKRRIKPQHPALQQLSNNDIRRLARRGGAKRISSDLYSEAKLTLIAFLKSLLMDAKIIMEYAGRSTLLAMDVVYALKRKGLTFFGFK